MTLDTILGDEAKLRTDALAALAAAPEYQRSAFVSKLAAAAKEAAAALEAADEAGDGSTTHATRLGRACVALSILRVTSAKMCLFRLADEGTAAVKTTLANSLRGVATAEGRAVLVYLLSDDDAQAAAIIAIGSAPWPEVLPDLIEIAEGDDNAVRLAVKAIARCGALGGPNEANAAADFLVEQLDDDAVLPASVDALIRFGIVFPGVPEQAKRLIGQPGKRKVAGLCLLAACGEAQPSLVELATAGAKTDERAARTFLSPLLRDPDERVRQAAERASQALGLG